MNTKVIIREELKSGDLGSIISLHGNLYSKEYNYDYTFEAYVGEAISQFAKRKNSRERIWIVEYKKEIVGSIAICEYTKDEAQLRWFLISPKLRGKGIGEELISNALKFTKEKSYNIIHLWTVKGLNSAKKIYLNKSFKLVDEVTHNIWGSIHTEQKYIRKLKSYHPNS